MGVSLFVGNKPFEIGAASFFTSFFSTIYVHLENEAWGSRFPVLMNELYQGRLTAGNVAKAQEELFTIRAELAHFPPSDIVWDYEFRDRKPPWGDNIAPEITSLANYFVTSNGKDLFEVMASAFALAQKKRKDVEIQ